MFCAPSKIKFRSTKYSSIACKIVFSLNPVFTSSSAAKVRGQSDNNITTANNIENTFFTFCSFLTTYS